MPSLAHIVGAHRDAEKVAERIRPLINNEELVQHYIRVMTVGCPNEMVAETSRANALKYWRGGNNPSINKHLEQVMKTMNKEERNCFVIALSGWMWRFIPHLFYTPQHLLKKLGKNDRLIFDATFRHDEDSIPLNMMTSTATELDCLFGDVKQRLLVRIWNLRISHPAVDIVLHANDVKSCFRQLKHHPSVMGAFSYIMAEFLFLQCSQTFGSLFSPANWEVLRRIAEILGEALFEDDTLRAKHRKYLDRLRWQPSLGSPKAVFTPAKADSLNRGVLDADGNDVNTPHAMYVDDDCYAEIFNRERVEQAVAASIEAIFILLGESDLEKRQDPISFDKMEETMINYLNRPLGMEIHTRTMRVRTPVEYVCGTVNILAAHWHPKRKTFELSEIETLTGRLGYIADTAPWLRYMMSHLYTSIAAALGESKAHLILTRKDFRDLLKKYKRLAHLELKRRAAAAAQEGATLQKKGLSDRASPPPNPITLPPTAPTTRSESNLQGSRACVAPSGHDRHSCDESQERDKRHMTFAQSTTARMIHRTRLLFRINRTLRAELQLIRRALTADWVDMWRPIAHMVPRDPSGVGYSDSCLHAAGGFSFDMKFWWYYEWPQEVQKHTLRFVKNNECNGLTSINVLEYAALIINYVAAFHFFAHREPRRDDPSPVVLLYADNTTAEAWIEKACKRSFLGRALGLLQGALMINNPVGINVAHITSKDNEIADRISRITCESDVLTNINILKQEFPELDSCPRFVPSAELVSLVLDTLLQKKSVDPLEVSRRILSQPGRIIM